MKSNTDKFKIDNFKVSNKLMFKFLLLFLILSIQAVTFLVIININYSLKYYLNNLDVVKENFGKNLFVNKFEIEVLMWISMSFLLVGFLSIGFLNLFLKSKFSNYYKVLYIMVIAIFAVLSIVFEAISEYSYSKFYNLFDFLSQKDNTIFESESVKKMQEVFYNMSIKNSGNKYKWASDSITWWLAVIKIIAVIFSFTIWFKGPQSNKLKITGYNFKESQGSKFNALVKKFSLNNSKNISFWLIIATALVFLPPLAYIVNMSIFSTKMNSMLNWTFIVKDLYKSVSYNGISIEEINLENSYFAIKFLPIIISGFLMASIFIFITAYVKNWNTSKSTFTFQFIILLVEILSVLVAITYSSHEAQRITNLWNNGTFEISPIALKYSYLKETYGFPFDKNNQISEPWMSGLKYISQTIISLSFLSTIYTILFIKYKKLQKKI
ncbi:hypothetical protein [Spiroplasma cantharicola]|uniref:Uncharacterized protein n=1 Tax=Spiroplasma cantharicola TaxID=362837 RepID=A0A0M4JJD4_9MOLU|nr:hypothetical protein [Spiroplasma cantharicola]ALD66879.1 hypothetical protein SCANT_v1c09730 [Spiroplasma cantharicola]